MAITLARDALFTLRVHNDLQISCKLPPYLNTRYPVDYIKLCHFFLRLYNSSHFTFWYHLSTLCTVTVPTAQMSPS